jgi:pimeloyl-ACP methyl ester carboxylesterase
MSQSTLVIPRPNSSFDIKTAQPPISGPPESSFTDSFGPLLPPAQYLVTKIGKAAYYSLPPTSPKASTPPERVLFIHGVQTPALGMLPLARSLHAQFPASHFVLFDHWGHGLSDTPLVPHEASLFHGLIDDLLDHLDWQSAHVVGYSFGGALTVGYVSSRTTRVQSFTLVAPAGLIRRAGFDEAGQALLAVEGVKDEDTARDFVVNDVLEGGGLVVPADWKERVEKGEVVAEAVKEWQMREHKGHAASVVAVFRDGGVMDNDELFVKAAKAGVPNLVVLGETDDLCTKPQLEELGLKDVRVVDGAGHGVVRDRADEVARHVAEFWSGLA